MAEAHLTDAKEAYAHSIERLAELTDTELDDLAHVHELFDPVTDGVECDFKKRI